MEDIKYHDTGRGHNESLYIHGSLRTEHFSAENPVGNSPIFYDGEGTAQRFEITGAKSDELWSISQSR